MRHKAAILLPVGLALGGCTTSVGTISTGHSLEASAESVVVGRLEMEQTMRSFRERFPQLQQTAVKSLMTMA